MSISVKTASVDIRPATVADVPMILSFVHELAEYEHLAHTLKVNETNLRDLLFGPRPVAGAMLAFSGDTAVGFVLFYETVSTFLGYRGLFIEDLYVRPPYRKQGFGLALFTKAANEARRRRCDMMEWRVLNWNCPAIEFYNRLGAKPLKDWSTFRLDREALNGLAR